MAKLILNEVCLKYEQNEGYISSLTFKGKEYIGAKIPLFVLAIRDEAGKQERISTFDMKLLDAEFSNTSLKCTYADDKFTVCITANLSDTLNWGISIKGFEGYALEWVNYPQIATPDNFADNGGNSKLLWGFNEGSLVTNITHREIGEPYFEPEYPCKGIMGVYPAIVETQFMAYYDDESGMYFASHDKYDNLKGINFNRENGGVKLEYRHFCGVDYGEDYEMEYPMVVKFFHGDWHDACEIYRTWFKSLKKEGFIPIEQNKKLPEWYGNSPVIVTYPVRGKHDTDIMNPNKLFPYINVMPHVERFEKAFKSKVMILLMHWEGTAPWAPPIVWPPYGGEDELKKLIDALHERGDVLGVYCSGIGWTINSNVDNYNTQDYFDKNSLKDEMCISPEQDLPYSNICTLQRSGYDMCPTREFTVNTIKHEVECMVNAGIDYVQLMDQNHGGTSYFCYSRKHDHPAMPGKWQVDAVKNMLKVSQENAGKVLFGCESAAAESYIPYLMFSDNRFMINYYIGRPVPAYAYIYHEYINNFMGNQVCADWHLNYDKSPEAFFERMAHSFIAGDMLTVVINQEGQIEWNWGKKDQSRIPPNQENAETFIKNLNFWRTGAGKKYLHSGMMVKPFDTEAKPYNICRNNGTCSVVPEIHTSAWQATDGGRAQFFANYFDTEKECTVNITESGWVLNDGNNSTMIEQGKNVIKIPPYSAVMIENA